MKLAEFVANNRKTPPPEHVAYAPCASCWAHCDKEGTPDEPCWGRVCYEPDYGKCYRHFCAGHDDIAGYRPCP